MMCTKEKESLSEGNLFGRDVYGSVRLGSHRDDGDVASTIILCIDGISIDRHDNPRLVHPFLIIHDLESFIALRSSREQAAVFLRSCVERLVLEDD